MKHLLLLTLSISTLALTGCVSREQADSMIEKGCLGAAKAFLENGFEIKEIKAKKFDIAPGLGHGYRKVTISVVENDGWANIDKNYECVFAESFGNFKMHYTAGIYNMKKDGQIIGGEAGQIMGGLENITKMTKAAEAAMR